jgi:indole-3-glycerol phosphate synthase
MSYLTDMVGSTRLRVEELKAKLREDVLEQRIASAVEARPMAAALRVADEVSIIAEIKRASPARGPLNLDLNAEQTAAAYARAGAAAISVLTEPEYFRGSPEDLQAAARAGPPVLRKDFIIDAFQVLESRAMGADAVLVVVRAVDGGAGPLVAAARAVGMEALVEVHDEAEVERAVDAGAELIGINHRNLDTFEVDAERTAKLAPLLPAGCTVVALSGVSTRAEVEELGAVGADAVLVGESLIVAADPEAKLRSLRGLE